MIRVLVADDHAIIRDGIRQILADTDDLTVAGEAVNGDEALSKIRQGEWDIVVLDISMPGRSGLDLIKEIRNEKPGLPVLVLTMHREAQYAERAFRAGASGYLTKESDSVQMVAAIRKVAGGGVYVSPLMAEHLARGLNPSADIAPHRLLSDREFQIFRMIVSGATITDIGRRLSLSVKTISTHKTHILQKMNMANTSELIRYAIYHNLLDTPAEGA